LKINDGLKEIAFDKATQRSLTLQTPNTPKYTGAAWTAPVSDPLGVRPTELEVSNGKMNTKLQYCTSNTSNVAILRAADGDPNYKCAEAVVFVLFIPTETVDTFPKVKIGLYRKDTLAHMGWLRRIADGKLMYADIGNTYGTATEYTLKRELEGTNFIKAGDRAPPPLKKQHLLFIFLEAEL
jgi:hypothetical protein